MSEKLLALRLLSNYYAVSRLSPEDPIPDWANGSSFYAITKTEEELSIVCTQDSVPIDVLCERNWRLLKVEGILDFSLIGILSAISTILAGCGISIFVISTYNTDYILVKDKDIDKALEALIKNNYEVLT